MCRTTPYSDSPVAVSAFAMNYAQGSEEARLSFPQSHEIKQQIEDELTRELMQQGLAVSSVATHGSNAADLFAANFGLTGHTNQVNPKLEPEDSAQNALLPLRDTSASHPMPEPLESKSGPTRNRKAHAHNQPSRTAGSAYSTADSSSSGRDVSPSDSQTENVDPATGLRTVKMGEHSFAIPLGPPTVAPQLQASIRMTSTGRPSHARKVPENHVKVCSTSMY